MRVENMHTPKVYWTNTVIYFPYFSSSSIHKQIRRNISYNIYKIKVYYVIIVQCTCVSVLANYMWALNLNTSLCIIIICGILPHARSALQLVIVCLHNNTYCKIIKVIIVYTFKHWLINSRWSNHCRLSKSLCGRTLLYVLCWLEHICHNSIEQPL